MGPARTVQPTVQPRARTLADTGAPSCTPLAVGMTRILDVAANL